MDQDSQLPTEVGSLGAASSPLAPLGLDAYVAFFACLAIIIAATIWYVRKTSRSEREAYLSQFSEADLRMSRHQIGLVYRVVSTTETEASVIPVWNDKTPVTTKKEKTVPLASLMPFDRSRFF